MTLLLHCGAEEIDYEALRLVETPEPTATHLPIAHASVVEMVRFSLNYFGHEVMEEHHAVTPDGMRYFGLMSLKSPYGDYADTLGLRNSNDKRFPLGLSFGSRCFICDNLAFIGDHVVTRRHTKKLKHELPSIVASIIEPLRQKRLEQHACFERYQATPVTDEVADVAIMQLYRQGAINVTRIADVLGNFENPPHDYGDKSAWRLFNAVTLSLKGRVAENPLATQQLHQVIDGVCERIAA